MRFDLIPTNLQKLSQLRICIPHTDGRTHTMAAGRALPYKKTKVQHEPSTSLAVTGGEEKRDRDECEPVAVVPPPAGPAWRSARPATPRSGMHVESRGPQHGRHVVVSSQPSCPELYYAFSPPAWAASACVYTQVLYILPENFLWVQFRDPFQGRVYSVDAFFPMIQKHPFPAGGPAPILSCEDGNRVAYFAVAILRIVYDDIVSTCGSAGLCFWNW